jgi:nucleotide-binding universal stress UspA family protein
MIFHHILAAYDGSPVAEKALQQAVKLAESKPGSRLTVVHVYSRKALIFVGYGYVPPIDYHERMMEYEASLLEHAQLLLSSLPYTNVVMLQGDVAATILKYAHEHNCSLIVMGSRGLGAIKEWMLGSVSHHVVMKARIPVLIVK